MEDIEPKSKQLAQGLLILLAKEICDMVTSTNLGHTKYCHGMKCEYCSFTSNSSAPAYLTIQERVVMLKENPEIFEDILRYVYEECKDEAKILD